MTYALIVNRKEAQKIREQLEKYGYLDRGRRIQSVSVDEVGIPVRMRRLRWEDIYMSDRNGECQIENLNLPISKSACREAPLERLRRKVGKMLMDRVMSPELLSDLPKHWEKHADLILVSESSFCSEMWSELGDDLWMTVCECLGGSRLAKKSTVKKDGFRSPQVSMLYGQNGWVEHVDNGIRYTYDVTQCMFSVGNITEKLRVAGFSCHGETVLDLYAGIGYFTLPYLVHAGATRVIACEWNPAAVAALRQNLQLNNVADRCTVIPGDNRVKCLQSVADRVNLGLIPTSEPGWAVACASLRSMTGGILHIHQNVTSKPAPCGDQQSDVGPEHHTLSPRLKQAGSSETHHSNQCVASSGHESQDQKCHISCNQKLRPEWMNFAKDACAKIQTLLETQKGGAWKVGILHVEQVKSYAPHVDHLVVDIACQPITS